MLIKSYVVTLVASAIVLLDIHFRFDPILTTSYPQMTKNDSESLVGTASSTFTRPGFLFLSVVISRKNSNTDPLVKQFLVQL